MENVLVLPVEPLLGSEEFLYISAEFPICKIPTGE